MNTVTRERKQTERGTHGCVSKLLPRRNNEVRKECRIKNVIVGRRLGLRQSRASSFRCCASLFTRRRTLAGGLAKPRLRVCARNCDSTISLLIITETRRCCRCAGELGTLESTLDPRKHYTRCRSCRNTSFLFFTRSQRRGRALESGKQDQTRGGKGGAAERDAAAVRWPLPHRRTRKLPDIESARALPNTGPRVRVRGDDRVTCSNVNTVVCIPIAALLLPSACQR